MRRIDPGTCCLARCLLGGHCLIKTHFVRSSEYYFGDADQELIGERMRGISLSIFTEYFDVIEVF